MRKVKTLLCLLVIALVALAAVGCDSEPVQQETTPEAVNVYWCMDKEVPQADANGNCSLRFVCDGQLVTYSCTPDMAEKICLQEVMGLILDGDTITDMRYMYELPQKLSAWNYYIQSIGGNKVKLNSEQGMNGGDVMVEISDQTKIYMVSEVSSNPGAETQLQKYDGVTVISNAEDEAQIIFVSDRPYIPDTQAAHCIHCEEDVIWNSWTGDRSMPTGAGHYRLDTDVTLTSTFVVTSGNICLDLNGKQVKQTLDGTRIYNMIGDAELTIMDSVGSGVMRSTGAPHTGSYAARSGMAVNMTNDSAVLNLYSGTLDGSGVPVQWAGVVNIAKGTFNMYGGTILGSDSWSTGSGAVCVEGTFNLYDGRIVGGTQHDVGFYSQNPKAGATIYSTGFFNMYGGTIEGGESPWAGGSVFILSGTTTLAGGTITGGKSEISGGGVFVWGGTLRLSGDINITGNENGNVRMGFGYLELEELDGAKVGISMDTPGILCLCEDASVLDCLTSDDPNQKLVIRDGRLFME